MNNLIGLIVAGGQKTQLGALVAKRSVAAVPVAGKYRAIDFVLSNMVNSGIDKVGLVTQYSFHSLMDHLGRGREWDLDRRNDGLYIFPPYLATGHSGWYKGSADGMYNNISFLKRSREDYVVVTTGNCIYKTRYNNMLKFHIESNADITVMYYNMKDASEEEMTQYGILELDGERIIGMREKPLSPKGRLVSTGVYIMKRELLIDLLEESFSQGRYDFVKDILIKKIPKLQINGYEHKGYWKAVNLISSYTQINMDFLKPEVMEEFFGGDTRIFTKVKDETPAKYNIEAEVKNSIVADGCIIEGNVQDSVLFRGVRIGKGSTIKNCILMQGSVVGLNVSLENVIFDKEVVIADNLSLKGEKSIPVVIEKRRRIE